MRKIVYEYLIHDENVPIYLKEIAKYYNNNTNKCSTQKATASTTATVNNSKMNIPNENEMEKKEWKPIATAIILNMELNVNDFNSNE